MKLDINEENIEKFLVEVKPILEEFKFMHVHREFGNRRVDGIGESYGYCYDPLRDEIIIKLTKV